MHIKSRDYFTVKDILDGFTFVQNVQRYGTIEEFEVIMVIMRMLKI